MKDQMRAFAWLHFTSASMTRNIEPDSAAKQADLALAEFDKRNFFPEAPSVAEMAAQLDVVGKARELDAIGDAVKPLALPSESIVGVVTRLIAERER